jgi:hypothetical protein
MHGRKLTRQLTKPWHGAVVVLILGQTTDEAEWEEHHGEDNRGKTC